MAGNLRSPRKRALEIGTDASKFPEDVKYDHNGGFPSATPGQGGEYKDNAEGAMPKTGPTPHDVSKPTK